MMALLSYQCCTIDCPIRREIYIVRHGQTDYNLKKIVQGRGVDSSLNSRGRGQAETFYRLHKHLDFDKIYVSALKRSQQTMAPFASEKELNVHPELDEIDWGIHEGKKPDKLLKKQYQKVIDRWKLGELHVGMEGGESPLDVQNRMRTFLEYLQSDLKSQRVLICSHGRAICILLCTILDRPLTEMYDFKHSNLGSYKLIEENQQIQLVYSKSLRQINEEA